ncbi:hypothetical protein BDV11DRAFT_192891, partial [Aspergillus similis]
MLAQRRPPLLYIITIAALRSIFWALASQMPCRVKIYLDQVGSWEIRLAHFLGVKKLENEYNLHINTRTYIYRYSIEKTKKKSGGSL